MLQVNLKKRKIPNLMKIWIMELNKQLNKKRLFMNQEVVI